APRRGDGRCGHHAHLLADRHCFGARPRAWHSGSRHVERVRVGRQPELNPWRLRERSHWSPGPGETWVEPSLSVWLGLAPTWSSTGSRTSEPWSRPPTTCARPAFGRLVASRTCEIGPPWTAWWLRRATSLERS